MLSIAPASPAVKPHQVITLGAPGKALAVALATLYAAAVVAVWLVARVCPAGLPGL